jgi:Protein of unknown function (DUF3108)
MKRGSPPVPRFCAALFAVVLAILAAGPLAGQTRRSAHSRLMLDPKLEDFVAPRLRVGEQLDYRVNWSSFAGAATVRLMVAERRNLHGWDTWHLRALTHTLNPVRVLFAIDDQFDSYSDAGTLESHQYEMYLREQGKQENDVIRLVAQGSLPRTDAPSVIVLPGTRDPIGALYFLRGMNWLRDASAVTPVYDGRTLYDMHAQLVSANEPVTVPAGVYSASKISVQVFEPGQQSPKARFFVWLAQDATRTPVLMQADLPFGSVRAELTGAAK